MMVTRKAKHTTFHDAVSTCFMAANAPIRQTESFPYERGTYSDYS